MAITQAPKRFRELSRMSSEEIEKIMSRAEWDSVNPVQPDTTNPPPTSEADAWLIAADSIKRSPSGNDSSTVYPGPDDGTMYIPMSRIAMRNSAGKIPSYMLPGYVDDIMYGTMDTTNPAKAIFTGVDKDGYMIGIYASPTQSGDERKPADNIIFYDKTTNLQFRYVEHTGTTAPYYEFVIVPASRAIVTNYGIVLTEIDNAAKLQIDAKKADYFTMYKSTGPSEIGTTDTAFPLNTVDGSESSVLSATSANNKVTVSGLTGGARYLVNLQLTAVPKTLSANIIDVSLTCGTVPAIVEKMDMAGPSGASSKLDFMCEFKLADNATTLDITIKAEEAINVTTQRFTIFELL